MAENWTELATGAGKGEQADLARCTLIAEISCPATKRPTEESFGLLPGEPKAAALHPAKGSYYLKESSSFWKWDGIDTVVKLGKPSLDPERVSANGAPLDGFNIYLGGHGSGREVDAGLTWARVASKHGEGNHEQSAWRPFYRTAQWHSPGGANVQWSPGETVEMSLHTVARNTLELRIQDPGPHPKRVLVRDFYAPGFAPEKNASFKRVNSIDQVHNEGHPVKPSASSVVGTQWLSGWLLHPNGPKQTLVPFSRERRAEICVPQASVVRSATDQQDRLGAERVDIYASP